ncbi:serine hydrolase domain-containing protein [Streptococcus catagoni]|uniref:serine hydrolase domain-containing protein n=1 Tax=Streptococcus catagoni TaxID=2654874 RepID=UPI00140CC536|nr:serine hydrolase domain-containing protein [Streptococcus catagoni]
MTSKLFDLIEEQISSQVYHGASLALFKDGKWQDYYFGTIDGHEPVKAGLVYDLASVSKVVGVGTLCILMLKSGALELDRPLKDYYPDFKNSQVSLRQLLTHTSGLDPFIPNRDQLNAKELKEAMNHLKDRGNTDFLYSDVNFILLGFMLEEFYGRPLDQLFEDYIFQPLGMSQISFGPRRDALATVKGINDGKVHDPKAKVLENHTGSAGLFSGLKDLELFLEWYMKNHESHNLFQNYSKKDNMRSIAWRYEAGWLDHTGYTGPFIMFNDKNQAAIFLTNRTYEKDHREDWIKERNRIMEAIRRLYQ